MTEKSAPETLSPDHLFTLYQITGTMNSSLDFDEVLNNVMDSVMHITKAQRGFLMIVDEEGELRTKVIKGIEGETLEDDGYSTTIVKAVVQSRETLLTNNAQFDNRFSVGQSIIMRGLRAILCAPMLVKGRLLGVVYVDTSMRSGSFSESDRDLLSAVAGQAGIAIENARLYTVAVEKGRMEKELQMAREIQQALLPQSMPKISGYEVSPLWRAARETAGDFYDAFALGDDRMGIVIADVSDKGAGAALFMAVARTMIRSKSHLGLSPIETLSRTNDLILEDAEGGGMFVTIYHSHFQSNGHSIHVNAGHNPPLFYSQNDKQLRYLPRGGRAVGWFPNNPLEEIYIDLSPGDFIVYYTDGLTEAENPQREQYGEERLESIVLANIGLNADDMLYTIVNDVDVFCDGAPPFDDMTLVIVRYTG